MVRTGATRGGRGRGFVDSPCAACPQSHTPYDDFRLRVTRSQVPGRWRHGRSASIPSPEYRGFQRRGPRRQANTLMVDRHAPIQPLVHLDLCPGIAQPLPARQELQPVPTEAHGVVRPDRPLLREAEQGLPIDPLRERAIGAPRLSRRHREAGIEARQERGQPPIRLSQRPGIG